MSRMIVGRLTSPGAVVVGTLLATIPVAVAANLSLELWSSGGDLTHLHRVLTQALPLFLLGSLVVWILVVLVVATLGRFWLGVGVVFVVAGVLGFADHRKLQILTEPIYPSDLSFRPGVGFLSEMVGVHVLLATAGLSVLVLAGTALLGWWLGRHFRRPSRRTEPVLSRVVLTGRVLLVVAAASSLVYVSGFHAAGNHVRSAFERYGAVWRPWHQSRNYAENGVVAGMLYNLPMPAMARPRGYSEAAMRSLVERYSAAASTVNLTRNPSALDDVNVVSVLSESFSDRTGFKDVQMAEDPAPFTRALMTRTTSGKMLSQQYGGGTANVEFSVLTGMSTSQFRPQLTTPYQMLVPNYSSFPSAVRYFEGRGLSTTALHAFTSELYRRADVYPILGFDKLVFRDDMTHRDRVDHGRFISDAATFREVVSRLRDSAKPMFLNVVTMQNHFPEAGQYSNPIPVSGVTDPEERDNLEQYARGIAYSDAAMKEFLASLRATGEKTVVLFYGDHLPPIWHQVGLPSLPRRETPFFVYADFGTPQVEKLPTTSPIYLMNHVLKAADAPVSPYYALLGALERQVPAMTHDYYLSADRTRTPWTHLSREGRQLMHDYRLVQYDLSVGRRYSEKAMFEVPSGSVAGPAR